ncbi:hypothetical protein J7K27_02445 [Candidatus Bathyarchaeota archaeon]|nr:hypothetical protein [Candidatus Bathyarchaeota archaeon]
MPHISISDLFKSEIERGINILSLGRTELDYVDLKPSERDAVNRVIDLVVNHLGLISPTLAREFESQRSAFIKWAGVAKALFPEEKPITFPSQVGTIGVLPLFPQAIKYAATPSSSTPCYTDYSANSWDISLTAGTAAYIFGDGTNYYKASPQTGKHSMLVVAQNGLVEIATTPKIQQYKIYSETESKYGIFVVSPVQDVSIDPNKPIYLYSTPGMLPVYHDFGVMFKILPNVSGTSSIRLLGLVFYEHDLFSDTVYIS